MHPERAIGVARIEPREPDLIEGGGVLCGDGQPAAWCEDASGLRKRKLSPTASVACASNALAFTEFRMLPHKSGSHEASSGNVYEVEDEDEPVTLLGVSERP